MTRPNGLGIAIVGLFSLLAGRALAAPFTYVSTDVPKANVDAASVFSLIQVPDDFIVLSGDDAITLPLMAIGGRGIISVVSNEIPAEMSQMVEAAERGDFAAARSIHRRILPLMQINFIESNPVPVKAAMAAMNLLEEVYRLPMCPPKPESKEKILKVLKGLDLLKAALV